MTIGPKLPPTHSMFEGTKEAQKAPAQPGIASWGKVSPLGKTEKTGEVAARATNIAIGSHREMVATQATQLIAPVALPPPPPTAPVVGRAKVVLSAITATAVLPAPITKAVSKTEENKTYTFASNNSKSIKMDASSEQVKQELDDVERQIEACSQQIKNIAPEGCDINKLFNLYDTDARNKELSTLTKEDKTKIENLLKQYINLNDDKAMLDYMQMEQNPAALSQAIAQAPESAPAATFVAAAATPATATPLPESAPTLMLAPQVEHTYELINAQHDPNTNKMSMTVNIDGKKYLFTFGGVTNKNAQAVFHEKLSKIQEMNRQYQTLKDQYSGKAENIRLEHKGAEKQIVLTLRGNYKPEKYGAQGQSRERVISISKWESKLQALKDRTQVAPQEWQDFLKTSSMYTRTNEKLEMLRRLFAHSAPFGVTTMTQI